MALQLKFVLTHEELAPFGILSPEDYHKLNEHAKVLARAPISGVRDVAIGQTTTRRVFIGVSVEFEGLPLEDSITAEQFLVTNLALNFEQCFNACFGPSTFSPSRDLLERVEQEVPRLLMPHNNHLALCDPVSAAEICLDPEHCSHPKCRALTAANKSYAQDNECPSGVALICEGEVYRGWCIESGQNFLGLGPLQAALVDFVARGEGRGFENIVGAVLVEMKDAKVSQEATVKTILKTIAPACDFSVLYCYKTE